jgi:hypothetical protein
MPPAPTNSTDPGEVKLLGDETPAMPVVSSTPAPVVLAASSPSKQLSELPKDELESLAEDFGIDPTCFKKRQDLVAAIHDRRQLIGLMERDAMIDVVRWGRRPVPINASKEQIAQEITRIRSMKFSGLSHRGLIVLAQMRGVVVRDGDEVPVLIRKLKRQEGLFAKLGRKKRAMIGSMVSRMIGEAESGGEYQFLPPPQAGPSGSSAVPPRPSNIKEEIEEQGLLGGLTNRLKKTADSYVNQKLDEIESRIDRKLDEIDRRLAEWRDKEIANRIRILKITLWASVIVGAVALIYAYIKEYLPFLFSR